MGADDTNAPKIIVPGEYKYAGHLNYMKPRESPSKCSIVTCGTEGLYFFRHWLYDMGRSRCHLCERHAKAMHDRIRRMGERVSVPDEPAGTTTDATRGMVVFGVHYDGRSADDPEELTGPFFAREVDAEALAEKMNLLTTSKLYSVQREVVR